MLDSGCCLISGKAKREGVKRKRTGWEEYSGWTSSWLHATQLSCKPLAVTMPHLDTFHLFTCTFSTLPFSPLFYFPVPFFPLMVMVIISLVTTEMHNCISAVVFRNAEWRWGCSWSGDGDEEPGFRQWDAPSTPRGWTCQQVNATVLYYLLLNLSKKCLFTTVHQQKWDPQKKRSLHIDIQCKSHLLKDIIFESTGRVSHTPTRFILHIFFLAIIKNIY